MLLIIPINVILIAVAFILPNEHLKWNSYIIFGTQALTLIPPLLRSASKLHHTLLPSLLMLIYFLINQSLGSYMIPRGFGLNKDFMNSLLQAENYRLTIPYLLMANLILFTLSHIGLEKTKKTPRIAPPPLPQKGLSLTTLYRDIPFLLLFILVSQLEITGTFAIQTALILIHITNGKLQSSTIRYIIYATYIISSLAFNYGSKREIIMIALLIMLIESIYHDINLKFRPRNFLVYASVSLLFFALILTASILRGYGGFGATSFSDAILHIPEYIKSDYFADAIADNLELSYNYAAAVIPIEYTLNGRIDYQLGLTLIKPFFLPIPRELFPDKPDSVIMLFTKEYDPLFYGIGGSYPVIFPSELFINFNFLGWIFFFIAIHLINSFFVNLHKSEIGSFRFFSFAYLTAHFFILARGSGAELYIFNYLLALPFFLACHALAPKHSPSINTKQSTQNE